MNLYDQEDGLLLFAISPTNMVVIYIEHGPTHVHLHQANIGCYYIFNSINKYINVSSKS